MKKFSALLLIAAGCCLAQSLDFASLERLASAAEEANKVSLNHDQIAGAVKLLASLGDKKDQADIAKLQQLAAKVSSIEVRNYTFSKPGKYHDADLAPIRRQMEGLKGWDKVVDSREKNERSEIFLNSGREGGVAILSAEPTEVSVVLIKGTGTLKDLEGLSGVLGLPSIRIGPATQSTKE